MNGTHVNKKLEFVQSANPLIGIETEKNKFCVYVYLDTRKSGIYKYGKYKFACEPFYVGKGKEDRHRKYKEHNKSVIGRIKKSNGDYKIIIIGYFLEEEKAFALEKKLISIIGRYDKRKGPLFNFTDGGEGVSGVIKTLSEEHKNKISKTLKESFKEGREQWNKGSYLTEEHRKKISAGNKGENNSFYGCKHSEETRKILSFKLRERYKIHRHPRQGAILSEETKMKIGKGNKGKERSIEVRAKMSIDRKGKPQSPERILKQSIAITEWWRRRKENDK